MFRHDGNEVHNAPGKSRPMQIVADAIGDELGKPINVTNRIGADGLVGAQSVLQEKPDGYTVFVSVSTIMIVPLFLGQEEPLDPEQFKYIGSFMADERVLYAQTDAPYKTFEEFISYAKEHPGELTYGGCNRWATSIMKSIAVKEGLDLKYVFFEGGAPAAAAILGGHIDVCELGLGGNPAYQSVEAGKLRILVNFSSKNVPEYPNVQNVKALGYPFEIQNYYGFLLHAETPEYIREMWENALRKVMQDPNLINKMKNLGMNPSFVDGQEWEEVCKGIVPKAQDLLEYIKVLEE